MRGFSGGSLKILQITFVEPLENHRRTFGDFFIFINFKKLCRTSGEPPENPRRTPGEPPENPRRTPGQPSERTFCIDSMPHCELPQCSRYGIQSFEKFSKPLKVPRIGPLYPLEHLSKKLKKFLRKTLFSSLTDKKQTHSLMQSKRQRC